MEPRFGHDFGKVRVHADGRAAESARAVDALAYTVGHHVVFGGGRYEPRSTEGRRLLAHELAHTVQQEGLTRSGGGLRVDGPGEPGERQADRAAEDAVKERPLRRPAPVGFPLVQRQAAPTAKAPDPKGPIPSETPLTDKQMLDILVNERAFSFNRGGELAEDPKGVGRGVGPQAGGAQAGRAVFAIVQITDRDGKLVDRSIGRYFGSGDEHAEKQALDALELRLKDKDLAGGKMTVVVDQEPCPPSRKNCAGLIEDFARRYKLSRRIRVPTRPPARGGAPGARVRPRAAARGAQRTDFPEVQLRDFAPQAPPPEGTTTSAPPAKPAAAPSVGPEKEGAPEAAVVPKPSARKAPPPSAGKAPPAVEAPAEALPGKAVPPVRRPGTVAPAAELEPGPLAVKRPPALRPRVPGAPPAGAMEPHPAAGMGAAVAGEIFAIILQQVANHYLQEHFAKEIADEAEAKVNAALASPEAKARYDAAIAASRAEIERAQAAGKKVSLQVALELDWQNAGDPETGISIGNVLMRAVVADVQVVYEGKEARHYSPPQPEGFFANVGEFLKELLRQEVGSTVRYEEFQVPVGPLPKVPPAPSPESRRPSPAPPAPGGRTAPGPPMLLPEPVRPSVELLPGAPGGGPIQEAAGVVKGLQDATWRLVRTGSALVDRIHAGPAPTDAERGRFADQVAEWHRAVADMIRYYERNFRSEAVTALGELLDRFGPRLDQMRTYLVG